MIRFRREPQTCIVDVPDDASARNEFRDCLLAEVEIRLAIAERGAENVRLSFDVARPPFSDIVDRCEDGFQKLLDSEADSEVALVHGALFAEVTRFSDFQHNLGLATNVLKTRLDSLIALTAWGDRWSSPNGPPILYRHSACAGSIQLELTYSNCRAIEDSEATVRPGPGMLADYLANRRPRTRTARL